MYSQRFLFSFILIGTYNVPCDVHNCNSNYLPLLAKYLRLCYVLVNVLMPVCIIAAYQPLKLMKVVTGKVNEVCLRYRDNGKLATLPQPSPGPPISSCAIKNTRRRMEDRHVIIEDFHTVFDIPVLHKHIF